MNLHYDEQTEEAIIGSLLASPELLITNDIKGAWFYWKHSKAIFIAIQTLWDKADLISVKALLENEGKLEEIGWIARLMSLMEIITLDNISTYIDIMKNLYIKRKLQDIALSITSSSPTTPADVLIWNISSQLASLDKETLEEEESMDDLLMSTMDYIEQMKENELLGLSFGSQFDFLDKATGWIQRGKTYRLAWPSNVGKSWLMYNFLISMLHQTDKITFFSLENDKRDIMKNFFGLKRGVNSLPSFVKKLDYDFMEEAQWFFEKPSFHIETTKKLDDIFRIAIKNDSHYIFIDYLQLIQPSWNFQGDVQKYTEIATKLQDLASKYRVGIIDLSQVSNSTKREGVNGTGSDEMKGASAFKETADVVIHIFPDTEKEIVRQSAIEDGDKAEFYRSYNKIKVTKNRLWPWLGKVSDYEIDFNKGGKYINWELKT